MDTEPANSGDTAGLHPLDRWRLARNWSLEALAAALEIGTPTVSRYINGRRMPGPEVMQRIFKLTEGEVEPNHFYRLPKGAGNGEEPSG